VVLEAMVTSVEAGAVMDWGGEEAPTEMETEAGARRQLARRQPGIE
jgi:hypothetical protein